MTRLAYLLFVPLLACSAAQRKDEQAIGLCSAEDLSALVKALDGPGSGADKLTAAVATGVDIAACVKAHTAMVKRTGSAK